MDFWILVDGPSAAIVLGGTILGTVLRCGLRNSFVTLGTLLTIPAARFNASGTRAELAVQIQDIRKDGLLRAEPHHFRDREFDEVADALIERRSLSALLEKHRAHRKRRLARSEAAVSTLNQAAELGPVFGLVGTLISLSQLSTASGGESALSTAIPMAIVTTLYGLLIANFVFAPLARLIERRAMNEEAERQELVDWLADELHMSLDKRDMAMGRAAA